MIVATAGHVDHGKTSLVRHLTGIDTDRLEEEKARGLTIDLGFAYTDLDKHRIGFIDVPGHIRFINNMLAGVSVIDAGLLVVAADDGPMPQTREHLAVLDLLGVNRGLVAITKIDRVSPARVEEVKAQVEELLSDTSLSGSTIIACSSETEVGIDEVSGHLTQLAEQSRERRRDDHFRLAVDRSFSLKGAGLVVTGSVFSGEVSVGDEVFLLPQNISLRVRSLHRQNESSEIGGAGDRVSLNLAGDVQAEDVSRGNWIASCAPPATTRIDATIRVLNGERGLRHWTPVHLHTAANHVTARVATLEDKSIPAGETGLVQLILSEPINVWRGDKLVLRDQAAEYTLGGGTIIDPMAPGRGRTQPARLALLQSLNADTVEARLPDALATAENGFDWQAFCDSEPARDEKLEKLLEDSSGMLLGATAIDRNRASQLGSALFETTKDWLGINPTENGITVSALRKIADAPSKFLPALLERLVNAKLLKHEGGRYQLPGAQQALDPAAEKLWKKVEPILKESHTKPPVVHDMAKVVGLPAAAIHKLMGPCIKAGLVVRPSENRYFLPDAMDELFSLAKKTAEQHGGELTVKDYRDATGVGRNLSIEILEYFDRTGRTVRMGDTRKLQRKTP